MSAALSMTEDSSPSSLPPSTAADQVQAAQPSQLLRQAREAAGLQLASLSATLKVPVERLQALEEGRYQDLPNLTFARALASSVCRALKIDAAPVLQGLPQGGEVKLGSDKPQPARVFVSERQSPWRLPSAFKLGTPLLLSLLVLALAVLLWWWLPQRDAEPVAEGDAELTTSEPPAPALVSEERVPAAAAPAAGASPAGVPPVAAPAVAEPVAAPAAAPAPAATLPLVLPASPAVAAPLSPAPVNAAAPAAQSAQPRLQLRARATTWVQLKDGAGKELQQRTLQPGQTLDYDGELPLQVVLGRASGVEVIVRGQVFDTSAYAPNKVARFEVK